MNNYTYIPIESVYIVSNKSLIRVELVREKDDRWSVGVPALANCVAWGRTKVDALRNVAGVLEGYMQRSKI